MDEEYGQWTDQAQRSAASEAWPVLDQETPALRHEQTASSFNPQGLHALPTTQLPSLHHRFFIRQPCQFRTL